MGTAGGSVAAGRDDVPHHTASPKRGAPSGRGAVAPGGGGTGGGGEGGGGGGGREGGRGGGAGRPPARRHDVVTAVPSHQGLLELLGVHGLPLAALDGVGGQHLGGGVTELVEGDLAGDSVERDVLHGVDRGLAS